jgi:hypothetical protein
VKTCRYCLGVRGGHSPFCRRPRLPRRRRQDRVRFVATGSGAFRCLYCARRGSPRVIGLCEVCQAWLDAEKASPEYPE